MDSSTSPSSPIRQSLLSLMPGHRRRPATNTPNQLAPPANGAQSGGISNILRGRAPSTEIITPAQLAASFSLPSASNSNEAPSNIPLASGTGRTHRIRLVPLLENSRSLHFEPIVRDAVDGGPPLKIGRFTDRQSTINSTAAATTSLKIAFKSKVVSRGHAEVWSDVNGKFFIKDTKSSSGTFLNHIRLSAPNTESRPFPLKDGDVIQLGVDYQGGAEEVYRCVKIRVEVGREWQAGANAFNVSALKQIHQLNSGASSTQTSKAPSGSTSDCCICLYPVTVCQALFIAPCSHAYHFKCIRPLINQHFPGFSCPLCRTFADLEADVEIEQAIPALDLTLDSVEVPAHGSNDAAIEIHDASSGGSVDAVNAVLSDVEEAEGDFAMLTDTGGDGDEHIRGPNDATDTNNASIPPRDIPVLVADRPTDEFSDELVTPQTTNFITPFGERPERLIIQTTAPAAADGDDEAPGQDFDDGTESEGQGTGNQAIHVMDGGVETLTGPGPSRAVMLEGGVVGAKRKR